MQFIGIMVLLLGIGMVIGHWQKWRAISFKAEQVELKSAKRQFQRRIFTSSLMTLIGAMLVFSKLIDKETQPLLFVSYWLGVLALTGLIAFVAILDMLVVRNSYKTKMAVVEIKQKQLEKEAILLKQKEYGDHTQN